MKKVIGLVVLVLLFLSGICLASIETNHDDFDGRTWLSTRYTQDASFLGLPSYVYFQKYSDGTYYIQLEDSTSGGQGSLSFDKVAEIKIDGVMYPLDFYECHWDGDATSGLVWGFYSVPLDIVEKIQVASKIAIRCNWSNGSGYQATIYIKDVPIKKIAEWKQIIDTTM